MIICFEGPSAVGKTTLSQSLFPDFQPIPEVNQLFSRPIDAPKLWYFQKQVERYQMARKATRDVILDGDIFQPLWYNWVYDYPPEFPSKMETTRFYQSNIEQQTMAFPDLYFIFNVSEEQLRQRKQADATRTRRHFEHHLQLIAPQQRYFRYLKKLGFAVEFIEYNDFDTTRHKILETIASHQTAARSDLDNFHKIVDWLTKSLPNDVHTN